MNEDFSLSLVLKSRPQRLTPCNAPYIFMCSVISTRVLSPCIQALLEVVNDLFEEQTDLEKIVKKIMHRAQTLLKCERCSVLLLEDIESPVSISAPLVEGLIDE